MCAQQPDLPTFQTAATLRALLAEADAAPRKRFGQHFLIDRNLMQKLVDAAEVDRSDCVLEVGPGTGSLSALLARRAGWLVAVEVDRRLAGIAAGVLSAFGNVTLLECDALEKKSAVNRRVIDAIAQHRPQGGALKLVANLPYDIATPLVIDLLVGRPAFDRLCFSVQAEVADRFLAPADTSNYGPVSIVAQALGRCRRVVRVPPQAFWPRPKVDSAILRIDPRVGDACPVPSRTGFAEFVRSFFLHRRKTMQRLARKTTGGDRLLDELAKAGLASKSRPQQLSVSQWIDLYRAMA